MKLSIEQLEKVVNVQKQVAALHKEIKLCGIHHYDVHMRFIDFIETFNTFGIVEREGNNDYPYEVSTVCDGVPIIAIASTSEIADLEKSHPEKFEYISKQLQMEPS